MFSTCVLISNLSRSPCVHMYHGIVCGLLEMGPIYQQVVLYCTISQ